MQGWNNCLPHKTEPLLPHPSTYSKSLPSLLNDTVKKPRNYPPPKSSIQVFPANKEEKKAFKSKIPNSQTNGYLFIYVYFFFVYSGKYIQKNNFSRTPREHLLACMETNFSVSIHNIQFHSIPFYCIYVSIELWYRLQWVIKSISAEQRWGNKAKFTAEARHRLPTASLNKENSDTGNKGKPFHESLLYWNCAQQMQFKWKGNFCCRL